LVLNKPSGWAVHAGSGVPYGVIEALRALRPDLPDLELAHRLDRDTSGCLLLAKNRSALNALHDMLRAGAIEKKYLALVQGRWPASVRRVDVALKKNVLKSGERVVMGDDDGKEARTDFHVRRVLRHATLVEVGLLTGRTHQVRVHAAHVGHPLAGDDKYGNAEFNKEMRRLGLKRLFLHAYSLRFRAPGRDRMLTLQAPLPVELDTVLEKLTQDGTKAV
jgi:23S rRNA pseudouridine955/2504/2580 synthase